jgi:hypothetical protein
MSRSCTYFEEARQQGGAVILNCRGRAWPGHPRFHRSLVLFGQRYLHFREFFIPAAIDNIAEGGECCAKRC